jgi:hypothetical protein
MPLSVMFQATIRQQTSVALAIELLARPVALS